MRYEAADQNGHVNSECGTEIVIDDTTPPTVYVQDCYTNPEEEDCTLYFKAYAMASANAVPAAGVALVALVAGVAFKAGKRSTYMPL